MANLSTAPISISNYHSEYINTILRYKTQQQKGLFVRYYNINVLNSANASNTKSVVDIHTDYVYDVYEYTPIWEMDELTDTIEDNPETNGLSFQGATSITIHSVQTPRIHDIVSFAYPPYTSNHAYRVKGISTMLNARDSGMYIFKLELENAFNISQLGKLNIFEEYVYSMVDNANILRSKYEDIILEKNTISNALSNMMFDAYVELYYYIDGSGNKIAPLEANSTIYNIISTNNNIRQYFGLNISGDFPAPYGVLQYQSIAPGSYYDYTAGGVITDQPVSSSSIVSISTYSSSSNDLIIQDCAKLLTLFQG